VGKHPFMAVGTGGSEPVARNGILLEMARQTQQAIAESDVVIFLVDARAGVNAHDHEIARLLRKSGQRVFLAVNKAEGMRYGSATAELHELGLGEPHPISASHGDGVVDLIEQALSYLDDGAGPDMADDEFVPDDVEPVLTDDPADDGGEAASEPIAHRIKLAIVGRPNVGKSTLINTLLGEDRVIAFDMPGTTRDAIEIDFERGGVAYTLIDTAGLRRRGKVF